MKEKVLKAVFIGLITAGVVLYSLTWLPETFAGQAFLAAGFLYRWCILLALWLFTRKHLKSDYRSVGWAIGLYALPYFTSLPEKAHPLWLGWILLYALLALLLRCVLFVLRRVKV